MPEAIRQFDIDGLTCHLRGSALQAGEDELDVAVDNLFALLLGGMAGGFVGMVGVLFVQSAAAFGVGILLGVLAGLALRVVAAPDRGSVLTTLSCTSRTLQIDGRRLALEEIRDCWVTRSAVLIVEPGPASVPADGHSLAELELIAEQIRSARDRRVAALLPEVEPPAGLLSLLERR